MQIIEKALLGQQALFVLLPLAPCRKLSRSAQHRAALHIQLQLPALHMVSLCLYPTSNRSVALLPRLTLIHHFTMSALLLLIECLLHLCLHLGDRLCAQEQTLCHVSASYSLLTLFGPVDPLVELKFPFGRPCSSSRPHHFSHF